jgi:hypothetical protein
MVSIQALVSRRLHTVAVLRARSSQAVSLAPSPIAAAAAVCQPSAPVEAPVDAPTSLSSAQRLMLDYRLAPGAALPAALLPPVCESVGEK